MLHQEGTSPLSLIRGKYRQTQTEGHSTKYLVSTLFKCPVQFSSVQSLSRVRLFATPWIAARQASLSITNSQSLCKLMSIESVMPSNHLILCHPLLLPSSIFPSIRVFSNESVLHIRWPKYWSFSFNISPLGWYWLDLLVVQATLKSLLQHHSSKASILRRSAFFIAQLSHPYMPKAWKTRERLKNCHRREETRDMTTKRKEGSWIG